MISVTTTSNTDPRIEPPDWDWWQPPYLNRPEPAYPMRLVSPCMHDNCSECHGTGVRGDGLGPCIHMMACQCPKCSPRC